MYDAIDFKHCLWGSTNRFYSKLLTQLDLLFRNIVKPGVEDQLEVFGFVGDLFVCFGCGNIRKTGEGETKWEVLAEVQKCEMEKKCENGKE